MENGRVVGEDSSLSSQDVDKLLESRAVIEQAKGMLMERLQLDADAAFAFLVRLSQNNNRKVHEIAAEFVASG